MALHKWLWRLLERIDPFAKPIYELNQRDLRRYPIWEFALSTEWVPWRDETWVRPLKQPVIPWNEYSLTVAATIMLASGREYEGFADVSTARGQLSVPRGIIMEGDRWLSIPNPGQWRERESHLELQEALRDQGPIYPLRWRLKVAIQGEVEPRSGVFVTNP